MMGGAQAGNAYGNAYQGGLNSGMSQYGQNTQQFANANNAAAGQSQAAAGNQYQGTSQQGALAGQAGSLGLQAGSQTSQNAQAGGQMGLTATGQAGQNAQAGGALGVSANQGLANTYGQQSAADAAQTAGVWAGIGKAAGSAAGMLSDKNAKTNIQPSSKATLDQLMAKVRPVTFDYKASSGEPPAPAPHVGVVAQDLEQTPLKDVVKEDDQGRKVIDTAELAPALLNLVVELYSQVKNKKDK